MSTLCGFEASLSYTSAKSAISSFCGKLRSEIGGPGSTALSCSSARTVGSAAPRPEVSTTPLTLNGAFWKSGTFRSYCTEPTLPPLVSCAATRSWYLPGGRSRRLSTRSPVCSMRALVSGLRFGMASESVLPPLILPF